VLRSSWPSTPRPGPSHRSPEGWTDHRERIDSAIRRFESASSSQRVTIHPVPGRDRGPQGCLRPDRNVGIGWCPISLIRDRIAQSQRCFRCRRGSVRWLAFVSAGWRGRDSSPCGSRRVVMHRERYDDLRLGQEISAYEARRHERFPIALQKQCYLAEYGRYGWSTRHCPCPKAPSERQARGQIGPALLHPDVPRRARQPAPAHRRRCLARHRSAETSRNVSTGWTSDRVVSAGRGKRSRPCDRGRVLAAVSHSESVAFRRVSPKHCGSVNGGRAPFVTRSRP
jgi:hypothetical protein